MNPDPFTLRELFWMRDGRDKQMWNHTAALRADLFNLHGRGPGQPPRQMWEFHPDTCRRAHSANRPVNLDALPVVGTVPASHAPPMG